MEISVDAERLRADIERTGAFGAVETTEGHGRTVLAGTEPNRRAREYLCEQFDAAGLTTTVDAVGNVAGTWTPASADPDAAPVAVGSHLDSVPEGGIFDGPLGVYAGLEAVRALQDAGVEPTRPITVVSFTEEEGQRFADGLLGSSVAVGHRSVAEALALEDDDGVTLETALSEIGFRGEGLLAPSEWDAWFELHVEQDTVLETAGVPVGVVTTITGITHCEATLRGEANHAGATGMDDRTDALAAAAEFVSAVERAATEVVATDSESAVGTVGSLDVAPNATNVVPGTVTAGVDVRDVERESMERIVARARETLARLERERGVETSFERPFDLDPTPMSDRLRRAAHDAGAQAGLETLDLHSGAAHDTMHVADATDAALLFAPSRDGISHNPLEWTDWDDCAAATRVLAGALADAAGASRDGSQGGT
ncbi:Zn-dependent hydrolase [Halobaculum sp. MBLA0147]|uniref:Zn-dependent hydrolase n=1 Tax=Halobaculum sp. MBLA0147 TaxID=3079934 RepID=UPI0035235486